MHIDDFYPNWMQILTEYTDYLQTKNSNSYLFPSNVVLKIYGVDSSRLRGGAIFPVGAIKPFQKTQAQRDDVIKKASLKPQWTIM